MRRNTSHLHDYGIVFIAVSLCTVLSLAFFRRLGPTNTAMVYVLGVIAAASRLRRGPAAFASAAGVIFLVFFFAPPKSTLSQAVTQYSWVFAAMFASAMITSHLAVRLSSEAGAARMLEMRTAMIHKFSEELARTHGTEEVVTVAAEQLAAIFESDIVAFVPGHDGLEAKPEPPRTKGMTDKERGVAQWVFYSGQPAGRGTESLPDTEALYVPIPGGQGPAGVLRVSPRDTGRSLAPNQRRMLDSFVRQIGMALDILRLQADARKAELAKETEQLRSTLLSCVSHDLRSPLAAIMGSAGALLQGGEPLSSPMSTQLLENIQSEGERLSRLVQNLLDATRLESEAVHLHKELYPVEEVIGSALERLETTLKGREVKADLPEDLPAVRMEGLLVEQVLINLLENAVRHTPAGTPIELSARVEDSFLTVAVSDRGRGLRKDELDRVFEKFYRSPSSPGAGLGLAICRAIVQAHSGSIRAGMSPGGGAIFSFSLPLEDSHGES